MVAPKAKKACSLAIIAYGISERRACKLIGANRSMIRYKTKKFNEDNLIQKIKTIAYEKRRFGYRRIHMMLKKRRKYNQS
ncbi:MAG: hypothetical protein H0V82_01680 [Candidatus Protochlamydia sp.]|nr:hypothetical protein [Candidatus Protochlamydia sp.]